MTEELNAEFVHIALDIQKIIHEKTFKTYYEETIAIVRKIDEANNMRKDHSLREEQV